jgi:hypothetical protein
MQLVSRNYAIPVLFLEKKERAWGELRFTGDPKNGHKNEIYILPFSIAYDTLRT